jgi:hypothetical protein
VCPAASTPGVTWTATLSGVTATGTCIAGFTQDAGGPPTRLCQLDGLWGPSVSLTCLRTLFGGTASLSV